MKDINLFRVKDSLYLREVASKEDVLIDLNCDGFLVRGSEKVCRSIVASLDDRKEKRVIAFVGGDDLLNRRALETLKIDFLVSPELGRRKDGLKQRDSGLNHVVAKIAKEKGIGIVVDFGDVSRLEGVEMGRRIARIMQNVRVCRKAGCDMKIMSFGRKKGEVFGEKARRAFGEVVGMSSLEVRRSTGEIGCACESGFACEIESLDFL